MVDALALIVQHHGLPARPWLAWTVFATMVVWTALARHVYPGPGIGRWRPLTADLVITFGCQAATAFAVSPGYLRMAPPLTATWFGGVAPAAAVIGGRRWSACRRRRSGRPRRGSPHRCGRTAGPTCAPASAACPRPGSPCRTPPRRWCCRGARWTGSRPPSTPRWPTSTGTARRRRACGSWSRTRRTPPP
nr:hypothetical protein [Nocardiopsis mwathae]